MRPLSRDDAFTLLGALDLKTGKARPTDEDFAARLAIYARDMMAYPADIAGNAIRTWRGTFFPSWHELASAIESDRRLRDRRLRIAALEAFLTSPPTKPPMTPAEREAVKDGFERLRRELSGSPIDLSQ